MMPVVRRVPHYFTKDRKALNVQTKNVVARIFLVPHKCVLKSVARS